MVGALSAPVRHIKYDDSAKRVNFRRFTSYNSQSGHSGITGTSPEPRKAMQPNWVGIMYDASHPQVGHTVPVRGFAVILHESDYLDLIARHTALDQSDYSTYLADLYCRMVAARQANKQVLIGPFLTDQSESYAEAIGEPAASARALRAYDDFVARVGPHTQIWAGEPISQVVTHLREATDIRADQARLLPLLKHAADLHSDPQRAADEALTTSAQLVALLLKRTTQGHHTLTCAIQLPHEHVSYALEVVRTKDVVAFPDGGPEQLLCAALATAHLADHPATLTLHSHPLAPHSSAIQEATTQPQEPLTPPHRPDPATIRAWRLIAGSATPLTASQASDLARTTPTISRPAATQPEPSAQYADAFPVTTQPP